MRLFLFIFVISLALMPLTGRAEQESEDVFASVVVLPAFRADIDYNYLDFGLVKPGESVTLKKQTYYNTLSAVSNKGIKYYLKIYIFGDVIGPEGIKLPPASFKWKVDEVIGRGTAVEQWQEFSAQPALVYTSAAEDQSGSKTEIRFQYRLDLPASARAGYYSLKVAYMLTEEE